MAKAEKKRRKKKRQQQLMILKEDETESQVFLDLIKVLEDLEKEGKLVDIQICPRCKGTKVRRVRTVSGDLWGHMGILPPKFECKECGWRARLVLQATNRPLSIKDVAVIAEASDLKGA
jgi:hypothetical protein